MLTLHLIKELRIGIWSNKIMSKQQNILNQKIKSFGDRKTVTETSALNCKNELYFSEFKFVIVYHRSNCTLQSNDKERQCKIWKELGFLFIRISFHFLSILI